MICNLYDPPIYFLISPDPEIPTLLYYSHIPAVVLALLVGFFVFFNARHLLLNKLLLVISLCFAVWTTVSLISWTNINGDFILFLWPLFGVMQSFIAIFSVYFIYVFLEKKDVSAKIKSIFLILLAPVLLLATTDLSVSGFNITWCDAFGYEGLSYKIYYTALGILSIAWILILLIRSYKKAEDGFKRQIIFMGAGIEFFLLSFLTMTFVATYLVSIGILEDSRLEFYGLFGMLVFMVMMGIMIVQFKTFKVGMIASNALVIALLILIASQFTFTTSVVSSILTGVTLMLTAGAGFMLVRSVKKEIRQRKEIETLAGNLEKANVRLKTLDKQKSEFVSIASHQLRSPLTSIRGYASLLIEGSYAKIPKKAIEPLERISESARLMALAIEDYLNVSRIESGNMKYNLADFNLADEVSNVCDDLRSDATKRGLGIIYRTDLHSQGVINADLGKTVQVIRNLMHNSLKYTPKGSVKVLVRDNIVNKKIYVDIIDTGIGMNTETLQTIFQKFERANNANSVNVEGTGLGLFVALKMAKAMGGDIKAKSEGDGKGSIFTLELPLAM